MSKCKLALMNTNRDIVNEIVINIFVVFDFIQSNQDSFNIKMLEIFNLNIKKPLLECLEPVII